MSAASRVLVAVTGALTTVLIARLLGADGAGSYSIALTLVLLLTVASTLGVEHGIAYQVSSRRWHAAAALRSAQKLAFTIGLALAAVTVVVRLLIPQAFAGLGVAMTAITVASVPFALSWFYATYVAVSVDQYEASAAPPGIQSCLAMVLVSAGALADGLFGAVVGLALSHALAAAVVLLWARRWLRAAPPATAAVSRPLREAIAFGIKGYASVALQLLNYRLDLFILSAAATTAAVGHYSVAVAVTSVMWLLPPALSDVLFPRVAALTATATEEAMQHRAFVEAKSLRHTALIVGAFTVVLTVALLLLVVPVYGPEFQSAIDLGLILLPGVALLGLGNPLAATIVGRGKPAYTLYVTLITTPVTIALYIVLIPRLDATGAALASSISYALTFVLMTIAYRRATGTGVLRLLRPTRSEISDYRALPAAIRARLARARPLAR
jgi:O-antigen/teichoic acid export membrane protein